MADDQPAPERPEDLSDELARKYDPERLLRLISRRVGRGQALDHSIRHKYEQRFGVDLGHVRVITGEFAEEFNRQRNAYAVTIGATGMILMGNSPEKGLGTTAGQALLAHELTHVAQAKGGLHRKAYGGDLPFGGEHEDIEEEAEQVEASEASGGASGPTPGQQAMAAEDQRKQDVEKIKKRVLELAADAWRTQMWRNGSARRA